MEEDKLFVPDLGFPGETHPPEAPDSLYVPCNSGTIRIYNWMHKAGQYTVFFPTPIGSATAYNSNDLFEIKMLITDYLSREFGRAETKQVPIPQNNLWG
jgi:hypothetical protein